jgi:hypothetical protein
MTMMRFDNQPIPPSWATRELIGGSYIELPMADLDLWGITEGSEHDVASEPIQRRGHIPGQRFPQPPIYPQGKMKTESLVELANGRAKVFLKNSSLGN